jgi:hypothetical protein
MKMSTKFDIALLLLHIYNDRTGQLMMRRTEQRSS